MNYYFDILENTENDYSKIRKNPFEYLFFFLSDQPLYSSNSYSEDYILFLNSKFQITTKIKTLKSKKGLDNFWFHEKEIWNYPLSSKVEFSKKMMNLNIFDHHVEILSDEKKFFKEMIFKNDISFSGKGIKNNLSQVKFPCVAEEKLNRVLDFSIYFQDNEFFIYENLVDQFYQYKGSVFDEYTLSIEGFLKSKNVSIEYINSFINKIELIKLELPSWGSLDCFIYKHEGELRIHPACEVNLRKTMGSLLHAIWKKYLINYKKIEFRIEKNRNNEASLSPFQGMFFINYY